MKTQLLQVSSTVLENHNRLQVMCNRHDELVSKIETRDHIDKLKTEEELNYYKVRKTYSGHYYLLLCYYFIVKK